MTSKKPSLAVALHEVSGKKPLNQPAVKSVEPVPSTSRDTLKAEQRRTSRSGKRLIGGHFDPAVIRQLKQLALDQDSTIQQLIAEALNDLFIKHDQKPIA